MRPGSAQQAAVSGVQQQAYDRVAGKAAGWAFRRFYAREADRRRALPAWIHHYNHHRPHSAIGKVPPITRLTNLPGQYS